MTGSKIQPAASEAQAMHVGGMAALAREFEEHREKLLCMLRRELDPAMASRTSPEDVLSAAHLKASARWETLATSGMTSYSWIYRHVLDSLKDARKFHRRVKRDVRRDLHWPDGSAQQIELGLIPCWLIFSNATSSSKTLVCQVASNRSWLVFDRQMKVPSGANAPWVVGA